MKKQNKKTIVMNDDDSINFQYSEADGIMHITIFDYDKSCELKISLTRAIELGYEMVNTCSIFKKEFET